MGIPQDADDVISHFLKRKADSLEQQIKEQGEMLDIFMTLAKTDEDGVVSDQLQMITLTLERLITELLEIRKNSEFTSDTTYGIVDRMGRIKAISHESLIKNMREKYTWT